MKKNIKSHELSPLEFKNILNGSILIDVRTFEEFKVAKIGNPLLLDYYSKAFKNKILKLDKNKTYLLYCKTGVRSLSTLNFMLDNGFEKVYHLLGGIEAFEN